MTCLAFRCKHVCYHVNERYVDEDAGRHTENPRRCRPDVADQDPDDHTDDAEYGRHEVVEQRLADGHSGVKQYGEVPCADTP
jgi:hypothetical protein